MVVLLLIILGVYYLLSQQLWRDYQTTYEMRHGQLQTEIDRTLEMSTTTSDEKQAKLGELKKLAQQSSGNCQTSMLIGWQSIIAPLQEQKARCEDLSAKDQTLKNSLDKIVLYLEAEQALMGVITFADLAAEVDETAIEKQVGQWQGLLAQVKDLKVSADFEPTKQTATASMEAIIIAWQALQAANAATDQQAYEEARIKLTESYDGLAAIAPASEKRLILLIQAVHSAYTASF